RGCESAEGWQFRATSEFAPRIPFVSIPKVRVFPRAHPDFRKVEFFEALRRSSLRPYCLGSFARGAGMDSCTQTWRTVPARPESSAVREACLVHIYPTGRDMGKRYPIGEMPLVLGRRQDCDVQIAEPSVSRRHARIQPTSDAIFAFDLQSTNGTFVNEESIDKARLIDGDYLRVGNCIYRFLAGGNVEAEYHEEIYRLTIKD